MAIDAARSIAAQDLVDGGLHTGSVFDGWEQDRGDRSDSGEAARCGVVVAEEFFSKRGGSALESAGQNMTTFSEHARKSLYPPPWVSGRKGSIFIALQTKAAVKISMD